MSNVYSVSVSGKKLPVYPAKIGAADDKRRFLAVDDLLHSDQYFDTAAFGYFDLEGEATITITGKQLVNSVKVLPYAASRKVIKKGNTVTFKVSKAQNLTIEINGEWIRSLHLFVNPIEKNRPKPGTRNVLFFGPGVHRVSARIITDNQTVYIAGGAIVKVVVGSGEKFVVEPIGLRNYEPRFWLKGRNIVVRGRGILDASECPVHTGNFITVNGSNIKLEGVILLNSCGWTVPVRQSSGVVIDNIKILGYRGNSDGVDICNSTNVIVKNCFVRTNDDLIVVKTFEKQGEAKDILVQSCVLWNPFAHALSIGAEVREPIKNVTFEDCDILHDQGREWTLRVFNSDTATVNNISFNRIRVHDSHNLISLWIGRNASTLNNRGGSIKNIYFNRIDADGSPLNVRLEGWQNNFVENVQFKAVKLNGRLLQLPQVVTNPYVRKVAVSNN
jgi:hypothetical protein